MPINAVIKSLGKQSPNAQTHYSAFRIHETWFNLKERDGNNTNIHPYHLLISYAPTKGHVFVSVYYEEGDWKVAFDDATKRLPAIKQTILDDPRWAEICSVLGKTTKFAEREEKKDIHGHFKFQFDYSNGDQPPTTQAQLEAIKKMVGLIFDNF